MAEYVKVMEVLDARETLNAITVSSFPTMKKEDRSKVMRGLHKNANMGQVARKMTGSDLAKFLGGAKDGGRQGSN